MSETRTSVSDPASAQVDDAKKQGTACLPDRQVPNGGAVPKVQEEEGKLGAVPNGGAVPHGQAKRGRPKGSRSTRRGHRARKFPIKPLVWTGQTVKGLKKCQKPSGLQTFAHKHFGMHIPDQAVCPGHNSPMDYLYHSVIGQEDLLVWANRGGGKTQIAAIATLMDALTHGPLKISVLGGSFDQSDRLADYVRNLLHEHPSLIKGRMTRQRVRLVNGSVIQMLAQSQTAVRGQHVEKLRCDEVDLFDEDIWRAVQFVTRSSPRARGSIEVLSTLHRSGGLMEQLVNSAREAAELAPGHGYRLVQWCLWEVIERCDAKRQCSLCPLSDDCRGVARKANGFFPIDDAIAIKARSSRAAWESEMLCRGVQREHLVFPEFDPARHVGLALYSRDCPLYRAIDFGYRSPMVCLWIQVTPGGFITVLDEYVAPRLALPLHAAAILERDQGRKVTATYVDPAGNAREATSGASCTELLSAAGIRCTSRASTIVEGLELLRCALSPALGQPSLVIHPRCRKLIRAMQNYHYGTEGDNRDRPVKDGPDHLIDALRYFFINRLRPGYEVKRALY